MWIVCVLVDDVGESNTDEDITLTNHNVTESQETETKGDAGIGQFQHDNNLKNTELEQYDATNITDNNIMADVNQSTYNEELHPTKPTVPQRYITPKLVVIHSSTLKRRVKKRRTKHVAPPPPGQGYSNRGYQPGLHSLPNSAATSPSHSNGTSPSRSVYLPLM